MKKKLSNNQIILYQNSLQSIFFADDENFFFPIKLNFALSKNFKILTDLAGEIEKEKIKIGKHYGKLNEEGSSYIVPPEQIEEVQQKLMDLYDLDQNVDIMMVSLEDIQEANLSTKQMQALLFMIEE